MTELEFNNYVFTCGNTGALVRLPANLDKRLCGNIMAEVAASFIDSQQDIKAIIILAQRRRLRV